MCGREGSASFSGFTRGELQLGVDRAVIAASVSAVQVRQSARGRVRWERAAHLATTSWSMRTRRKRNFAACRPRSCMYLPFEQSPLFSIVRSFITGSFVQLIDHIDHHEMDPNFEFTKNG